MQNFVSVIGFIFYNFFFFCLASVGEAGDVPCGAAQGSLFHHVPCGCYHVRGVVPVRADRTHSRRDAERGARVALLDEAGGGGRRYKNLITYFPIIHFYSSFLCHLIACWSYVCSYFESQTVNFLFFSI